MKKLFSLLICVLNFCSIFSQENIDHILIAGNSNVYTKVSPPSIFRDRIVLGKISTGALIADFSANVPQGEVRDVLNTAINIWNMMLKFNTTVTVRFDWKQFSDPTILGGSFHVDPFFINSKYYPPSLANVILGSDQNGFLPEIVYWFSGKWNFGLIK